MQRRQLSDFDAVSTEFEVAFYEGALQTVGPRPQVLSALGSAYTSIGRFEDGLVMDRMLACALPVDPIVRYNLACSLSLTGRVEQAIQELIKSVALGYSEREHLLNDPDLEAVRAHELFGTVLELIDQRRSAQGSARQALIQKLSSQMPQPFVTFDDWVAGLKEVPKPEQTPRDQEPHSGFDDDQGA